tara:strand:+ start:326 stop:532 length:207 start_codon:yes stop_codon:yes gene_type:complete
MPIEIKELVIKTTITSDDLGIEKENNSSSNGQENNLKLDSAKVKLLKKQIIQECMDNVSSMLRRLKDK